MTKEIKDYTDQLVSDVSFKGADLSYMKSLNAKFIDCDFTDAILDFCDFRFTRFENCIFDNISFKHTIGDMQNIFSFVIEKYIVSFTATNMCVGCQQKSIKEWKELDIESLPDDEDKEIWKTYKKPLFEIVDLRLKSLISYLPSV